MLIVTGGEYGGESMPSTEVAFQDIYNCEVANF